jgi:hypothetical protein
MIEINRDTDTLFIDITSDSPKVSYDTVNLFLDDITVKPKVSYDTVNLFFDVFDFDASFPIYAVLLDFIEAMSLGDIIKE